MSVDAYLADIETAVSSLPPAPPDGDLQVAFLISMRSVAATRDWAAACERLASTLRTVLAQSDPNFRILIAGHEKPQIEELHSHKVTWITVDTPRPTDASQYTGDKNIKRRHLGVYLGKAGFAGLAMALDADDWLHYRFVEYLRRKRVSVPHFLDGGFVANWHLQQVWTRSGALNRSFYLGCGSSAVYPLDVTDFPADTSKAATKVVRFSRCTGNHNKMADLLRADGIEIELVQLPFVTWVLGHGNNNTLVKGKKPFEITHNDAEMITSRFARAFHFA